MSLFLPKQSFKQIQLSWKKKKQAAEVLQPKSKNYEH